MQKNGKQKNSIEKLVSHLKFKRPQTQQFEVPQLRVPEERSPARLPPIHGNAGNTSPLPQESSHDTKSCSRYHSGCTNRDSFFLDWSMMRRDKRNPKKKDDRYLKIRTNSSTSGNDDLTNYLQENKEYLESYILENVSTEELEKWLVKKYNLNYKMHNADAVNTSQHIERGKHIKSKQKIFIDLTQVFREDTSEHAVVNEIAKFVAETLKADDYKVYKLFPEHPNFVQYFVKDNSSGRPIVTSLVRAEPDDVSVVLDVAREGRPVTMSENSEDSCTGNKDLVNYLLYQTICSSNGKPAYVIEISRKKQIFTDEDVETSSNNIIWGNLTLYFCNLFLDKKRERNMSDFLLEVVRAVFEEMVSLDQLIKRILEFAQRLVNADRASLFLVDYRNFELVSTVFDLKFEPGQSRDVEKKEIRMPINRGIAGHVALSGETMNIPDAYSDYRFNREVDEATGYKTISILCMPIKVQGKVIGVVQMVNKRNDDNFDHEDETAFEIFSSFFGLALHHARLYDRIMRKEQKYRVALEVLSYHNTCKENEVQSLLQNKEEIQINLNDFLLDPYLFNEFDKCKAAITMFNDLFDISKFDVMTLTRFVLTVKKNYRTVPYHNFDHGWAVAHAMYVILKNDTEKLFNSKMSLALFVSCLCHDLDHRGYTNKYMSETASPLAAMYTTSTLEHHHFNITVTILQQDGHNIFSHMNSDEYKDILGFIRHCILATDLAAFFPNLAKMKDLHKDIEHSFNWSLPTHRDLAMAISMTAADLSASAKPWEVQIKTVKVIFEEFYDQGDKEREAGKNPIPMMDRNQPDEQPASQVGFLSQICIPCYKMLFLILPHTKPMYAMAMKNLNKWKFKADRILQKRQDITAIQGDIPSIEHILDISDVFDENNIDHGSELSEETIITDDELAIEADLEVKKLMADVIEQEGSGVVWEEVPKRSSTLWEDEEASISEQKTEIWKEIDTVTWIDEEGLVVAAKKEAKTIQNKDCEIHKETELK